MINLNKIYKRMKACSLLVLFCLLSVILCDTTGITTTALKSSFKDGLAFMKAFHKKTYTLGRLFTNSYTLTNPILTENNADFKVENGLVRVIFQNINLKLNGYTQIKKSEFRETTNVGALLENARFEIGYTVSSNKLSTGKYEVKYSKVSESALTFKIVKLTSKFNGLTDIEEQLKAKINSLDFASYKNYLVKIANLVIETLPNHMK